MDVKKISLICVGISTGLLGAKLFCHAQASWSLVFFPIWFPVVMAAFFICTAFLGFHIYEQRHKDQKNG